MSIEEMAARIRQLERDVIAEISRSRKHLDDQARELGLQARQMCVERCKKYRAVLEEVRWHTPTRVREMIIAVLEEKT